MNKVNHWFRRGFCCVCTEAKTRTSGPIEADTCTSLIKQCGTSLHSLKTFHASMLKSHLHRNLHFLTNLIAQYASLGSVSYAYSLFSSTPSADLFLWNVMIRGLVDNSHYDHAILLYKQMLRLGIQPDNFTFPFIIKACSCLRHFEFGIRVHQDVVKFGYQSQVFISNSLITMYGKCDKYELSRQVFDEMPDKNAVSWSAIIGACLQDDRCKEGFSLFRQMLSEGSRPSRGAILNAMACVRSHEEADDVYRVVVENGLDFDQSVQSAAAGMFVRCGRVEVARKLFDGIMSKDLVTWATTIEAYVKADLPLEALGLLKQMMLQGIFPDAITLLGVIRACSTLASFQLAHIVHGIITTGFFYNQLLAVETALIDLYVKCGSLTYARKVFDGMQERNIITWSAMISGYGMHGWGREALNLFDQMKASVKPDHITFVSILSACSHSGLVAEGWECFNSMATDFGVTPRPEHYACMSNAASRAVQRIMVACHSSPLPDALIISSRRRSTFLNSHYHTSSRCWPKFGSAEALLFTPKTAPVSIISNLSMAWFGLLPVPSEKGKRSMALLINNWDMFLYNTLMDLYFSCGDEGYGRKVFDKMRVRNVVSWTTFIAGLVVCGDLDAARRAFDQMPTRNVVSWTAIINAYVRNQRPHEAFELFWRMLLANVKPNEFTLVNLLKACSELGSLKLGRWIHDYALKNGFDLGAFLGTALIDMYSKCGSLDDARQVFPRDANKKFSYMECYDN
ncbi:pentatricopeptide repeat-containing protein [Populus alba x Populus x berolinensis]|uniref:Pentatricopeptide repeat-containing protein n=1 Tax=Populus alba x Populus x berolinensis TaxID=444605 RepID=A0AAD6RG63_9ROSI|nr:pentatricopeptide repeat-containing protein [Populus alba x Populus x berolinensis]